MSMLCCMNIVCNIQFKLYAKEKYPVKLTTTNYIYNLMMMGIFLQFKYVFYNCLVLLDLQSIEDLNAYFPFI